MEKLCIFCKNFYFENIETWGNEYPETNGGIGCRAKHFYAKRFLGDVKFHEAKMPDDDENRDVDDIRPNDEDELRNILLSAEKCPDYERPASEQGAA